MGRLTKDQLTLREVEVMFDVDQAILYCNGDGDEFYAYLELQESWELLLDHYEIEHCPKAIVVFARGSITADKLMRVLRRMYREWR